MADTGKKGEWKVLGGLSTNDSLYAKALQVRSGAVNQICNDALAKIAVSANAGEFEVNVICHAIDDNVVMNAIGILKDTHGLYVKRSELDADGRFTLTVVLQKPKE